MIEDNSVRIRSHVSSNCAYQYTVSLQLEALQIPANSPLRNAHSLFWEAHTNDEGPASPYHFHGLVQAGKIKLVAPNRAEKFGADGRSIVLSDGTRMEGDAVILGTGFKSSWGKIFDRRSSNVLIPAPTNI